MEQSSTIVRLENTVDEQGTEIRNLVEHLTVTVGRLPTTMRHSGNLDIVGSGESAVLRTQYYDGVTSVTGRLWINSNNALTSLGTAFSTLTTVGGYLRIENNRALTMQPRHGILNPYRGRRLSRDFQQRRPHDPRHSLLKSYHGRRLSADLRQRRSHQSRHGLLEPHRGLRLHSVSEQPAAQQL